MAAITAPTGVVISIHQHPISMEKSIQALMWQQGIWRGGWQPCGSCNDGKLGCQPAFPTSRILLEYTEDSVYRWRCWHFGNFWSLFCWVIWIHGILVHFLRATRGDMWRVSSVTYTGLVNSSCVIAADPSLMYLYRASVVHMNGYLIGKKFVILFLNIM